MTINAMRSVDKKNQVFLKRGCLAPMNAQNQRMK